LTALRSTTAIKAELARQREAASPAGVPLSRTNVLTMLA
jgi:hypothetical protein